MKGFDVPDNIASLPMTIHRAQSGHRSAMGRLFEEYSDFLRSTIARLMGPKLRRSLDPDDVLQETLLAAASHFDEFHGDDDDELRAWLVVLARHKVVDCARHNGRLKRALKGRISLDEPQTVHGESLGSLLPADVCTASQVAIKREMAGRLAKALSLIDPEQASALRMRYVDGMTLEQIGQQFGTGRNGASGIVSRGLRNLRRLLPQ